MPILAYCARRLLVRAVAEDVTSAVFLKVVGGQVFHLKDSSSFVLCIEKAMRIGRGFQFALTLPVTSDAHYAGARVKQGDVDCAIFWYKPVDSTNYRVIYADFSVKELGTAPKVPNAEKLTL